MKYTLPLCVVALTVAVTEPQFAGAADGVPRIGIISDAGARSMADLLLIELQKTGCELVERDAISAILKEQALSVGGLTAKEGLKIGKLLKADGLLLIVPNTNGTFTGRLVAVSPGVIVWRDEFISAKEKKTEKGEVPCEQAVASVLRVYLPKLSVKEGAAIPVSLLSVRPEVATEKAARYAADVNRLLQFRMVREPSLFVLERENLMLMEEEHRWSGRVSDFWTGSYVVAGGVSHDITETNKVSVRLTLSSPSTDKKASANVKEFIETGRSEDIPRLVGEMVQKISSHLGAQSNQKAWDPLQEAQAFADFAGRQVDPARQKASLETAMALGLRNAKVGAMYRGALCEQVTADYWLNRDILGPVSPVYTSSKADLQAHAARVAELLSFCSSYGGQFSPEDEQGWLYWSEVALGTPMELAGTFLILVKQAGREADLGEQLDRIRFEARRLGCRMWFRDDSRATARKVYRPLEYLRYFFDSSEDIIRVFTWYYEPPKTGTEHTECGWFPLRRELIDPVFGVSAKESKEERDLMWDKFLAKNELNREPKVVFQLILGEYRKTVSDEEKRHVRLRLHEAMRDNLQFLLSEGLRNRSPHWLTMHAFPSMQLKDGEYWRIGTPGFYDRRMPIDEVREIAGQGIRIFTGLASIAALRSGDADVMVWPYVPVYTMAEVTNVYLAIRRNAAKFRPTKTSLEQSGDVGLPDSDRLVAGFEERFPSLKGAIVHAESPDEDVAPTTNVVDAVTMETRIARLNQYLDQYSKDAPNDATSLSWRKLLQDQLWEDREVLLSGKVDAWQLLGVAYRTTGPQPKHVPAVGECRVCLKTFLYLGENEKITDQELVEKAAPILVVPRLSDYWPDNLHVSVYRCLKDRAQRDSAGGGEKSGITNLMARIVKTYPFLEPKKPGPQYPVLKVTKFIEWPYSTWTVYKKSTRCHESMPPYWKDNRLWFHHYGEVLGLDPDTRTVEVIGRFDVPLPGYNDWCETPVVVTDSFYVFLVRRTMNPLSFLALRKKNATEWRTTDAEFRTIGIVEVQGSIYLHIGRTGASREQIPGIVRVDHEKMTFETVLDTLVLNVEKPIESDLKKFRQVLSTGADLIADCGKRTYTWNPESKQWGQVTNDTLKSCQVDQDPHRTASRRFGFEVLSPSNRGEQRWEGLDISKQIVVRDLASKREVGIPLEYNRKPIMPVILTAGSVLLRMERDTPAFHEIPYVDIQGWLSANLPVSNVTNAIETGSVMTGTETKRK